MLTAVRSVLDDLGLVSRDRNVAWNVFANRDPLYQVFADATTFLVVKVSAEPSLLAEHQALQEVFPVLGDGVPEPLGFRTIDGVGFLVSRGRPHVEVTLARIRRMGGLFADALVDYLDRTTDGFRIAGSAVPHTLAVGKLADAYARMPGGAVLVSWLDGPRASWLDGQPHVRQHGDFSGNNLGIAGRRLVYFDWEDFGRVTLPGFDLVTLMTSCLGFDPARVTGLLRHDEPRPLGRALAALRARLGLSPADTTAYVALCLLAFLDLKERYRYGDGVIQDVRTLLAALEGTAS